MKVQRYIFVLIHAGIFVASFFTSSIDTLVYISIISSLFMMLDKLGKGIVLREVIALFNSFIYLFMPLMGYIYFSQSFYKAAVFVRYMPIQKTTYFDLALPAISAFIVMMCWPLKKTISDEGEVLNTAIRRAKQKLGDNKMVGFTLIVAGVVLSNFIWIFPKSLQYVATLFYYASFAGLLYVYFANDFPFRKIIMGLFGLFIIVGSLSNGMFTIIAYMGMTMFSFFFLQKKIAMWKKLSFLLIVAFSFVILQTIKSDYRKEVLKKNKDDKTSEFVGLAQKKLDNIKDIFTPEFMFPIYYRTNQGFYVALVQKYIPVVKPHDGGQKLFGVILSSFVPRFLWPDKPMSGGEVNMKYYTGVTIRGSTMDVGPMGEAYGSFGVNGAIIYMFLLGMLIRFVYARVFVVARRSPLVIFWIPVIFYMVTYSGENDTLQLVNSIIKSVFFIYILSRIFPQLLNPAPRIKKVSLAH